MTTSRESHCGRGVGVAAARRPAPEVAIVLGPA
jgi:hypothetical protein